MAYVYILFVVLAQQNSIHHIGAILNLVGQSPYVNGSACSCIHLLHNYVCPFSVCVIKDLG